MTPLAVAIVGSGVISHNHAAAHRSASPRLRITAIVDPDPAANAPRWPDGSSSSAGRAPARTPTWPTALRASDGATSW